MAKSVFSRTDGHAPGMPILIAGASARSAAHSAMRAGLRPIGADCFADEDLRTVADVLPMRNYPNDLPRLADTLSPCPWMYTGALENYPQIITEISEHRPLWGNAAEVVRKVRDPFHLTEILRTANLPAAGVCPSSHPPAADGCWMLKPLRGSAGRGICLWDESAARSPTLDEPHYFQQRRAGLPLSAVFVASNSACRLVGIARQFIGTADLHAPPFTFCGAIAPIDLGSTVRKAVQQQGEVLARTCGLRGLFGIDFLYDDHQLWLTEVNPRYTATVELFEHALGIALLNAHRQACQPAVTSAGPRSATAEADAVFSERADRFVAKAIVYADRDRVVPKDFERSLGSLGTAEQGDIFAPPTIADIPTSGSCIPAGHPVCTLFAAGPTEHDCLQTLRRRTDDLWKILCDKP